MNHTEKIKEILAKVRFACMATVNQDGSPHNSPLVFLYDPNLRYVFWGSHPDSQHSQNILRTSQVFFAAYDSKEGNVGIYIEADNAHIAEDEELAVALAVHNRFRRLYDKTEISSDYYKGESPQRMWLAQVKRVWINAYDRDQNGKLSKDYKIELNLDELAEQLWH